MSFDPFEEDTNESVDDILGDDLLTRYDKKNEERKNRKPFFFRIGGCRQTMDL